LERGELGAAAGRDRGEQCFVRIFPTGACALAISDASGSFVMV
jgi:hypothetical protein